MRKTLFCQEVELQKDANPCYALVKLELAKMTRKS